MPEISPDGAETSRLWPSRARRFALRGAVVFAALTLAACSCQTALAQVAAPSPTLTAYGAAAQSKLGDVPVDVIFKTLGMMFVVLVWAASADWVSRDSQIFELNYKQWNPIVVFPFVIAFAALAFLPVPWWARLLVLLLVYMATMIPYVIVHNKKVQPHQTVLTGGWWRHFFAVVLGKVGVKVKDERTADYEKGAAVDLVAMGAADATQNNVNLLTARQSPGYLLVKDLLADMIKRRCEKTRLEYAAQGVAVRYEIDGMWHPGEPRDRESADVMLAVMKTLANLDVKERKKKQNGQFGAGSEGTKYVCLLASQGVQAGELAVVTVRNAKAKPFTYDSLGLREGLRDQWAEVMASDKGMAIFSTMPGGGLTTLTDASLEETDRLMRDFIAIEEVRHREREIQNIAVHTYDAAKGETPAKLIPNLARGYPNVYVVRDMVDAEGGKLLLDEIDEDRLVITSVRARDAAEALLRILMMKVPQKQFALAVSGVLYQRLIRKLCPDCKVGYQPPPDVLKKLGIPAGKVQQFFRPPKPEEIEKPCKTCQGIGFVGRTGIFELILVTDEMRKILAGPQPTVDALRKAARAEQQRSLQEEGILLVAKGVTSLPELQRALKGE